MNSLDVKLKIQTGWIKDTRKRDTSIQVIIAVSLSLLLWLLSFFSVIRLEMNRTTASG